MATLFAPRVRTIQPAFVNVEDSVIKIYFSIPEANDITDITGIKVEITNPRVSASSVNYKIYNGTYNKNDWMNGGEEFVLLITLTQALVEKLNVDQYYQAQLYFVGTDDAESEYSQVTLLRPIQNPSGSVTLNVDTREVSGSIYYGNNSPEVIKSYIVTIYEITDKGSSIVCTSKSIDNTNYGLIFSTVIDYYFSEGSTYKAKVEYTTINGYVDIIESDNETVSKSSGDKSWDSVSIELTDNENAGATHITIFGIEGFEGEVTIERSDESSEFRAWAPVAALNLDAINNPDPDKYNKGYSFSIAWDDYSAEGGKVYQYRFKYKKDGVIYFKNSYDILDDENNVTDTKYYYHAVSFGDIFLGNTEQQLAIRFNPSITGFKWVTQDSITNTLGGRYPLIRRNAETKYRQFNLSGTIYVDPDDMFNGNIVDSCVREKELVVENSYSNNSSLFISQADALKMKNSLSLIASQLTNRNVYEKKFRDMVMSFLTDGQVKLFRSFQEGDIIVYLSNISFTPNKQLDRRVYDFSATVTELCEATEENLKKYRIYESAKVTEAYRYILRVTGNNEGKEFEFAPYISIDQLSNDGALILECETYTLDEEE